MWMVLPLNAKMPMTSSPTLVITHGRNPIMSSVSLGMGEAHSSRASKMKTQFIDANVGQQL